MWKFASQKRIHFFTPAKKFNWEMFHEVPKKWTHSLWVSITCLEHSSKMRDQFGKPMKTASCAEGQRVEVVHHLSLLLELHFQFPWPAILIQLGIEDEHIPTIANPSFKDRPPLGSGHRFTSTELIVQSVLANRAACYWMRAPQLYQVSWCLGAFQHFGTSLIPSSCTCLVSGWLKTSWLTLFCVS